VGQIDAFGNKRADKSDDEDIKTDADMIKNNMRNSSKIYYKITHSVQEDISE
jgi:hypothetical protein